jgi:hypothetical protein
MEISTLEKLEAFLQEIPDTSRIALVTSGGTLINYESDTRIKIDHFSTGNRATLCIEELLINNYYVILLYREETSLPFIHNIQVKE